MHAAAKDLGRIGLVARTEDIFFGAPMGRGSDRTTIAVVAEINNDAARYLKMIVNGRPLSGSVIQAAANFGVWHHPAEHLFSPFFHWALFILPGSSTISILIGIPFVFHISFTSRIFF